MSRKWEYRLLSIVLSEDSDEGFPEEGENELNALGDEDWEVVTAVYHPAIPEMIVVLKREKV